MNYFRNICNLDQAWANNGLEIVFPSRHVFEDSHLFDQEYRVEDVLRGSLTAPA